MKKINKRKTFSQISVIMGNNMFLLFHKGRTDTMHIAVIDDNETDLTIINRILTEASASLNIDIEIALFSSSREFLNSVTGNDYRIIFLDVYMPDLDGIETARALRTLQLNPLIVFLTSSTGHYPEAFSVHAFDYLTKPVKEEEVRRVLQDVIMSTQHVEPMLNLSSYSPGVSIRYSDIMHITADGNYLRIQANEEYRIRATFSSMKEHLAQDNRFMIINRGILVNLDHVSKMQDYSCIMDNQEVFPLNRRKAKELRKLYIQWQFEKRNQNMTRGLWPC